MLQIRNLQYNIGDRQLLAGVDWLIQPGRRTALIGPNGAGKTTLLRILNGEIECPEHVITKPRVYKIGYLPQEEVAMAGHSILKTVLDGQKEVIELEKQIQRLHEQLDKHTEDHEALLKKLGELEHRFDFLDGYHLEATAKNILSGLGFGDADFSRPLTEFSGGWRMRVYLALLLVRKPDLLLLDEPTNHLDIPSLEWLEKYLLSFKGSIVAVSHDRFFIDRLAQDIVELDRGKLVHYAGNYHFYEKQKEQRESLLLKRWKEQKDERERQEKFINKFRYKATKAAAVQSRIKLLDKLEEIDVAPPKQHIDFNLQVGTTSYNDVLEIKDLYFKYETDWVLKNINLNIYRGDKVSLVGVNGAGKTTMTRLMVEQLAPQQGYMKMGQRVTIGYYAQHQTETLNLEATVYDEIAATAATVQVPRIRDVLGVFQFSGDDVYKKIRVLSGGEKARVSLAKILLSPVNFLIMDEPTNHLDKFSKEALERALSKYNGTLLLISHDRYFLDKLVNRVVELQGGHINEYDGNYSYYLEKREALLELARSGAAVGEPKAAATAGSTGNGAEENATPDAPVRKTKEQKRLEAEARQAVSKERNKLNKEIAAIEDKIAQLEASKESLETRLAQQETYNDAKLAVSLQKEYGAVCKDLEDVNQRWEEANLKLEEIIANM